MVYPPQIALIVAFNHSKKRFFTFFKKRNPFLISDKRSKKSSKPNFHHANIVEEAVGVIFLGRNSSSIIKSQFQNFF